MTTRFYKNQSFQILLEKKIIQFRRFILPEKLILFNLKHPSHQRKQIFLDK